MIVLVTDPAFSDDVIVRCVCAVADALPPDRLAVQLRDKRRHSASLRLFATRLRAVTRKRRAALIVNGRPDLARDVGADGVHVSGTGSVQQAREIAGSNAWVSVATHSDDDVARAVSAGADAVLVSPIFATRPPFAGGEAKVGRGVDALRAARDLAGPVLRVIALGGVTAERARGCVTAGAHSVAVIRALLASAEPARVARALHEAMAGATHRETDDGALFRRQQSEHLRTRAELK